MQLHLRGLARPGKHTPASLHEQLHNCQRLLLPACRPLIAGQPAAAPAGRIWHSPWHSPDVSLLLQTANGWAASDLLRLLGSMERGSSHPLAAAVIGYAAAKVGNETAFC